jgi:outer membrane receptor protein involved in Fe transport
LYGANALGGIINVVMRANGDGRVRSEARGTAGSFGERGIGASLSGGNLHRWDLSLQSTTATGAYPFSFNEYGITSVIRRDNADFSNLFGRAALSSTIGGVRASLSVQAFQSERGVPGAVVQGNREQLQARLDERELFSTARVSYAPSEWNGAVTLSGRLNRLNYRDPDAKLTGSEGINNRYDRREGSAALRIGRFVGSQGSVDATAELSYADLSGDNIDPSAGSLARRVQTGGAILTNWFVPDALPGIELSIDGGLRFDSFSDLDPALSPSVGVVLHPAESALRVRAHGALNYRAPSFSEQYYLNFGNTDLRPERSRSVDVGATYEAAPDFVLESTLFLIDTRDQIVAVPRSPVSWSAMNIGRVISRGVELAASGRLFEGLLDLHGTYTLMRAEDRSGREADGRLLVYSPSELANGIATLHIGAYSVSSSWQYVSHRHTLPLNPPESALPHYLLLGAALAGQWELAPLHVTAQFEAINIFDTDYQVVRNYPMPGRMFRIGMTVRYGDDAN